MYTCLGRRKKASAIAPAETTKIVGLYIKKSKKVTGVRFLRQVAEELIFTDIRT